MKDRLGTDEVDGLNDDEWKCFNVLGELVMIGVAKELVLVIL